MNKGKIVLVIAMVSLGILIFWGILKAEVIKSTDANQLNTPKELTFDDLKLGDLQVGMLYSEIQKAIKVKPKKIEGDENEPISISYTDDTSIFFQAGRAQCITVDKRQYLTPRGLVGDKRSKALKLYGEPKSGDSKSSVWEYSMGDDPMNFVIVFKGNEIINLQILVQEI